MKIKKVQVYVFQNIVDSSQVDIEPDVTCLVGKNESGKTAFLKAIYRLNPAYQHDSKFLPRDDYPRWRWRQDEKRGLVNSAKPVSAMFEISDEDVAVVESHFGPGALTSRQLRAARSYANELFLEVDVDEVAVVKHLAEQLSENNPARLMAEKCTTLDGLRAILAESRTDLPPEGSGSEVREEGKAVDAEASALRQTVEELIEKGPLSFTLAGLLRERMPKFFYFGQYSYLPGRIGLGRILGTKTEALPDSDRTALALLDLAGGTKESLTAEDYEHRVAELEASANEITRQVLEYWTTNRDIRVDFDMDKQIEPRGQPPQPTVVERYLDIRLHDQRHQFTTNFATRSSGFQWLFSFITAFSAFEDLAERVVVLLDEPALNLHARAQSDFLRFINERLSVNHQVIYTTHSPFMIEADKLRRVRLVEDKLVLGCKVTNDVLSTDRDTVFPLQGALGYDLSQNLFVGATNLVVEGTSDFIYLSVLSRYLERLGRTHLDLQRWTITPVGGASGVPTFVALLGTHLNVTVLVDAEAKISQRLTEMIVKGLLEPHRLITIGQVTGTPKADIEDLFTIEEYLSLYNEGFGSHLAATDLPTDGPIIKRIERLVGRYDHGIPATVLLRTPEPFLNSLSEETVQRFEKLFELVNQTMPS